MPPATKIGSCSPSSGSISCARTDVATGPICPPASLPSITKASTPDRANFLARVSAGAKQITFAPNSLIASMLPLGGNPPASTTCVTRCFAHTAIKSITCGCMVIRFTPNGFAVMALVAVISASSKSGVIAPQAITPNPPALEMADTRFRSDTHDIAPHIIATSQPRNSVLRFIRWVSFVIQLFL